MSVIAFSWGVLLLMFAILTLVILGIGTLVLVVGVAAIGGAVWAARYFATVAVAVLLMVGMVLAARVSLSPRPIMSATRVYETHRESLQGLGHPQPVVWPPMGPDDSGHFAPSPLDMPVAVNRFRWTPWWNGSEQGTIYRSVTPVPAAPELKQVSVQPAGLSRGIPVPEIMPLPPDLDAPASALRPLEAMPQEGYRVITPAPAWAKPDAKLEPGQVHLASSPCLSEAEADADVRKKVAAMVRQMAVHQWPELASAADVRLSDPDVSRYIERRGTEVTEHDLGPVQSRMTTVHLIVGVGPEGLSRVASLMQRDLAMKQSGRRARGLLVAAGAGVLGFTLLHQFSRYRTRRRPESLS